MKTLPALWKEFPSTLKEAEKLFADYNSVWLDLDRAFEAFDRTFPVGIRNTTFPPHDVVKTETGYDVSIAVAGFCKEDLSVEIDKDNVITISGKKEQKNDNQYLFKGIATRQFVRKWQLPSDDEVVDVHLTNGLLVIKIKRNDPLPVEESVKRLEIKVD